MHRRISMLLRTNWKTLIAVIIDNNQEQFQGLPEVMMFPIWFAQVLCFTMAFPNAGLYRGTSYTMPSKWLGLQLKRRVGV